MKSLIILFVAANIALVFGGGSEFIVPSPDDTNENGSGNCPNCATGQLDPWKNSFAEYRQWNLWVKKNAPLDGNCPGNRVKRIFNGALGNPPRANICCCEPTNSPFYTVWLPTGQPQ